MLSSINPLGERGRGQSFGLTMTFYLIGSTVGGILLGVAGGSLGLLLPDGGWRFVAIAVVAAIGAAMDLARREPPSWRRQVDENWLSSYRGWVYGLGFGVQLGLGLVTIVTSASLYSLVAITILAGSFPLAVVAGALFGLSRAIVILFARSAVDPASLRRLMRRLQDGLPIARFAVIGCQLFLFGVAVAVVI
jgi:hypothetical protein